VDPGANVNAPSSLTDKSPVSSGAKRSSNR
jgi:hypothetical protein